MQQREDAMEKETEFLKTLIEMEDLGAKKTKIYSRLLTDTALAKDMEERSCRHDERKAALERLLYGKTSKKESGGKE